jgi:filamentous hemagglutinin family protein
MIKRALAVFLCLGITFLPAISNAGAGAKIPGFDRAFLPPLPKPKTPDKAGAARPELKLTVDPKPKHKSASVLASSSPATLPVAVKDSSGNIILGPGISSISVNSNQNKMDVTQDAPRAIQNWSSFNISSNGWVQFEQPNSSSVALNRIFDLNPTQIFGKLTANGQIYLINQNGILFGRGSQVDVHTLIASTLNISDSDFMNGALNFTAQDYQTTGNTKYLSAQVTNQGTISTDTLGSVFLLGPNVTNSGTITTQAGQIGLAAGTGINLFYDTTLGTTRTALVVDVLQNPGQTANNGQITANTGLIGMYGEDVIQNGAINAITALKQNGQIELMASDMVYTGAKSTTSSTISTSKETADQSFAFNPGTITIGGLDPLNPLKPAQGVNQIVNCGLILAPSGTVNLTAQDRVYLENGSRIDVSGSWIHEAPSANTTQVQLNSVNLRDDPDQKNGILKGATITVDNHLGSSIGDISGSLVTQQKTALQQSLRAGFINIASQGDVIVKQGASLNFAGGGTRYSSGYITTTELVAGTKIYDISNAPETLHYNHILNAPKYVGGYVEGQDAGTLSLAARQIVLDGNIRGGATAGVYQTRTSELYDANGDQKTLGLAAPLGGTLMIGTQPANMYIEGQDFMLDSVVLQSAVAPLPSTFGPNTQPYNPNVLNTTYLSTQKLSAAGLGNLQIAANTTITVAGNADISLIPGASLSLSARQIDVLGKIIVPSGTINLDLLDNVTGFEVFNPGAYVPLPSPGPVIYLADGSEISAAGQRIDDSLASSRTGGAAAFTYIAGGTVSILDKSYFGQGVISAPGSLIDVSGGYGISQKGVVTGGNAGSLSIQGNGIVLDGYLKAYSILGSNGGKITLHAQNITVAPTASSNQNLDDTFTLGQHQLDDTGFTQINLQSANDLVVESGVSLSPSMVKLSTPIPGRRKSGTTPITVAPNLIGASSFSASANSALTRSLTSFDPQSPYIPPYLPNLNATIQVAQGAAISTAPLGSINLGAPNITIGGTLYAPAGTINVSGTTNSGLILLEGSGYISAAGYNSRAQTPLMPGLRVNYTPLAGGSITLTSGLQGSLETDPGSVIDVSGSPSVKSYLRNGGGVPVAQKVASNPGSISLSAGSLTLDGTLQGKAYLPGLPGATLSISSLDTQNAYTLRRSDLQNYLNSGFDALSFQSNAALAFSESMDLNVGRSLTLDAPSIVYTGVQADQVTFQAHYIQLTDSYWTASAAPLSGTAKLTLLGDWIDVSGGFVLSGFKGVALLAQHDITLSSLEVNKHLQGGGSIAFGQELECAGDLTLQADRIYPTTASNFTIKSDSGTITILPSGSHNPSQIYSAGGALDIQAQNIDMEGGYLEAPMGSISLAADSTSGRVYLASGSTVSTAGSMAVAYGNLNAGFWTITNENTDTPVAVPGAPQSSVTITGNEVILKTGSKVDISGGGSIYAYQFQSGIQGSVDPFQTAGRYVIVPSGNYSLPASAVAGTGLQIGQAVYLQGVKGLKSGTYTLLPEQYAFLPGAMVITATGANVTPGTREVSANGFPIVAGYFTYAGTSIRPSQMQAFEVQPASYVSKQGFFDTSTFVAGNAGSVAINGKTTVLDGVIQAAALPGYQGGSISLSGTNAFIQASTVPLPSDFNFDTPVTVVNGLQGTLQVAADTLSGKGFQEISIGNLSNTSNITMEQGSVLNAASVVLSAQNSITLQQGAQINAVDSTGTGSASLITPNGLLDMQQNSLVHASDLVTMTIGKLNFLGNLQIDHGALNLTGRNVYFVPQGSSQPQTDPSGLYLPSAFWGRFGSFQNVNLSASAGLVEFTGDINLSAQNSFTINAASIKAFSAAGIVSDAINAPIISLLNTGGPSGSSSLQNVNSLSLNANEIWVGEGALLLDGFASVNFNAVNDITFRGIGSLVTGGDLHFSSARITTSYYTDANTPYTAASFQIAAGGNVTIGQSGGQPGQTSVPGGTLGITAATIDDSGIVDVSSGYITFTATGSGLGSGIFLRSGSEILARGCAYAPGGNVQLNAGNGAFTMEQGALIDVSAGSQGDAGSISIVAPVGGASLQGTFAGAAQGGAGASFSLDTYSLGDGAAFSSLYSKLGDFTGSLDIRSRTGDLTINSGVVVTAQNVQLTADSGNLDLSGTINASNAAGGGTVELYAGQTLTLENGSRISAAGSQGNSNGGTILLSTTQGNLAFQQGATLDVSGSGSGKGGSVYLRAPLITGGTDVNMDLAGAIKGAKQVVAEGYQAYSFTGNKTIGSGDIAGWQTGIQNFMNNYGSAIQNRLLTNLILTGGSGSTGFNFVPGLEIDSTGNLTLNSAWDLTSWRYGANSVQGMLTLRAGGNLLIDQNIVDHPTSLSTLLSTTAKNSWGITLVAGADLSSADPSAVLTSGFPSGSSGNLSIANGTMVYSERAPIRLAAGHDINIGTVPSSTYMIYAGVPYNVGTYAGSINIDTGHDLLINGGAIQTATGNIDVNVGNDLSLGQAQSLGAIRTTGESPNNIYSLNFWTYQNGGNITIHAAGNITGDVINSSGTLNDGWDSANLNGAHSRGWSASYGDSNNKPTLGLATMAGGNLNVYAGGNFLCQAGTFGTGNLSIFSGGNMQGRFLIRDGTAELNSMGNFGVSSIGTHYPIEAWDAVIHVSAQGDIVLGTIVNPALARPHLNNTWNLEYSQTASVSLTAVTGDVSLYGDDTFYGNLTGDQLTRLDVLPPTLEIAAGRNINFYSDFALAPSATGNLILVAGGNIDGQLPNGSASHIYMSEASPDQVYGNQSSFSISTLFADSYYTYDQDEVLHTGDNNPVVVDAGGNISNLQFFIPKEADISAGVDILNIYYFGHNVSPDDVTTIKADGSILFSPVNLSGTSLSGYQNTSGIRLGGPGALVVEAGDSLDLGNTGGIQTVGNTYNGLLGTTGCTLIVASGYNRDFFDPAADAAFFASLQAQGIQYSKDMAAGNTAEANTVVAAARADIIVPFFASSANAGAGDINMTTSQISTLSPSGGIFIFTNGSLNVGKSTFFTSESQIQSTGIFTAQGGPINIFAYKDVNVNESRIMTFLGGDITVWSDTGSINAGRGSKTAVDASPPTPTYINGQLVLVFNPPAVGSGIRAVTYAPDGVDGPVPAPPAGNIDLFAPDGVIDAGEAGIAGRNVILGAVQVLNANNIIFSAGSVGVPVSTSLSGLGALTGTSAVTQGLQNQEAAIMNAAAAKLAPGDSVSDAFSTAWLEVRVLSFFEVDPGDSGWENTDN